MGLRLIISEIVGNINQMKTGIQETGVNYESALQVIRDFSQNTAFQSEAWTAAKNNIFEAHQSIVKGTVALHNIIDTDLGNLEEIIGAEDLDEDALLFEIQKLQEECQHYEDMIKKLSVMNNLWRVNGFGGVGLEGLITFYSALLLKTQIVLKIMEDKLESLREKAAITTTLFGSVEGLAQALENAIRDAEIYITGEGVPSDGSWKEAISGYTQEFVDKELTLEGYIYEELGISYTEFKTMYGEDTIRDIEIYLKEFSSGTLECEEKEKINEYIIYVACDCSSVSFENGKYQLKDGKERVMCEFSKEEIKEKVLNITYANKRVKKEYIANYLKENLEISDMHIAAIMGNMYQESSFCPLISQTDHRNLYNTEYMEKYINDETRDSSGWGLIQWSFPDRKEGLLTYAMQKGDATKFGDMETQLEYLVYEMTEGPYKKAYQEFLEKNNLREATTVFCRKIEQAGKEELDKRIMAAEEIYEEISEVNIESS